MNKRIIGIIVIIIFIIILFFGVVDYFKVANNYEKPIFCIGTKIMRDGGSGEYIGLGYSFNIKGNFLPGEEVKGVIKFDYYILGIKILSKTTQ